jgi:hypothetical protein
VAPAATRTARIHAWTAVTIRNHCRFGRARRNEMRAAASWNGSDRTPNPNAIPKAVAPTPRFSTARI